MTPQIRRVGVALMVLFALLFVQLNLLQVVNAERLATDPRNTRVAIRDFNRPRGTIQTADGVVLARSVETDGATFDRLRQYPEGALFAHVTGYFSFTFGAAGVERSYNDVLAGRDLDVNLDNLGRVLVDPTLTGNVSLTVDKRIQEVARQQLGDRKGAVVALDPSTGGLLALWSFPSFDPNLLAQHDQSAVRDAWALLNLDQSRPLLPRSYRETYPPGSTFKVITSAAVLERQPELATKDYPVLSALDLPRTDRDLRNFGGGACGGTLPDLLRVSCNTGFGAIALDLGPEALHQEAEDFGFNLRPPLDLPAVEEAVFPPPEAFDRDEPALAASAIGQRDVRSTPLEMALVAAGVGNGGVIMEPHVMAAIFDSDGELVRQHEPAPWKRAMSPENAAQLRDQMVRVVEAGTGTRARIPGVTVAGKTGSAQIEEGRSHAWFIGFAPAEAPRVAVAVLVESQEGNIELAGGRTAAPIAKAVMEAALNR